MYKWRFNFFNFEKVSFFLGFIVLNYWLKIEFRDEREWLVGVLKGNCIMYEEIVEIFVFGIVY